MRLCLGIFTRRQANRFQGDESRPFCCGNGDGLAFRITRCVIRILMPVRRAKNDCLRPGVVKHNPGPETRPQRVRRAARLEHPCRAQAVRGGLAPGGARQLGGKRQPRSNGASWRKSPSTLRPARQSRVNRRHLVEQGDRVCRCPVVRSIDPLRNSVSCVTRSARPAESATPARFAARRGKWIRGFRQASVARIPDSAIRQHGLTEILPETVDDPLRGALNEARADGLEQPFPGNNHTAPFEVGSAPAGCQVDF